MPIGRQLLYDVAGRRRSDEEVLSEVGHLGLRTALLADAVHRRAREDEPPSSQPHAVVSYPVAPAPSGEDRWVRDLVDRLTALGWTVHPEPRRAEPMTVGEFVSGIASCRLFVAVLTPSYWQRAAGHYDEVQVAMSLPYVHTLAITRSPATRSPAIGSPAIGSPAIGSPAGSPAAGSPAAGSLAAGSPASRSPAGNGRAPAAERPLAFDRLIRGDDSAALYAELTRLYRYTGEVLPPEAERTIRAQARAAATAKPPSRDHAKIVSGLADKAPWLGSLWLQLIDLRQRLGDEPGAIDAARRGAANAPIWEGRESLCTAELRYLYDDGQFEVAFRAAVTAVRDFPRNWLPRLVIGSLLDDLRRPWTGRNHLLVASRAPGRSTQVVNMLGVVYLHLGALARAERCFRDAVGEDPGNTLARGNLALVTHLPRGAEAEAVEVPGPACGCTACDSVFGEVAGGAPCAGCAAPRSGAAPCPLCGVEAVTSTPTGGAEGGECPVCRTGRLVMRDHIPL